VVAASHIAVAEFVAVDTRAPEFGDSAHADRLDSASPESTAPPFAAVVAAEVEVAAAARAVAA